MTSQLVAFVFMAALVLGGGLGAVTSRNVAHAALFLLLSLGGVAGVFILLVAEFLALVQVLIYGGAVTIVLLFALMLTRQEEFARVRDNPQRPLAAIAALALLGVLGVVFLGQKAESQPLDGPSIRRWARSCSRSGPYPSRWRRWCCWWRSSGRSSSPAGRSGRNDAHARRRCGGLSVELIHIELLSGALFVIGLYGVLARRNAVLVLISIELMLNAVNLNLVGYAAFADPGRVVGQVIAIFVITVAAAEVGLALAIILRLYRNRGTANVDQVDLMKW